ncbi:SDR family oxidoreductase [Actinoplanes sp. NBRC 103695]|uniref:SDR family oxidoreductase n=1 Tax=Actinoplanes sp. NBRC 103695 TaxID=3032202 RepID=UPI0024A5286A|nr:SDR family oxidoreductase [Actinoplanes sp. NBRC 103695]GLY94366.1 NAD(P)-dependent oxidoreductase [Actinoplanes sp. NBRC 103695]
MIVVSGATGRLGGRIARLLADEGVEQRLLVRDASRAPRLGNAEVAVAEYADRDAVRRALDGADTVLMVSGAESADRMDHHRAFVDAAADAGAGHVVYTSFYNAGPEATFTLARDHWATEEYLRAKGLVFTSLRDNLYADFLPMMVGDDGVIRGPGGDGKASVVAQDDIADAAVAVLLEPGSHAGRVYDLTGPQDLSFAEMAAIVSRVTRRAVRFHDETLDEAYASRASYGAPGWQVDAWVSTYTAVAAGELAGVSGAVEELTGRPATSLEALLKSK